MDSTGTGYIGWIQRPRGINPTDNSDFAITWGNDNPAMAGNEKNLRFIYLETPFGTAEPNAMQGQEVGRFSPEGNFGIGNFHITGLNEQPSQRLDVNGNARFRSIPDSTVHSLIPGYDPDTTDTNPDDRVLTKLDFPDTDTLFLAGNGTWQAVNASDCDWNLIGTTNLATGFATACRTGNVGIGTNAPANKVSVQHTQDNTTSGTTMFVRSNQAAGANSGISNVAARFNAQGREGWIIGGWGNATADGSTNLLNDDYLIGLVGRATATANQCLFDAVIGVYGEAISNPACTATPWAGYFVGGINTTGPSLFASDANLKTDIQPLDRALETILQYKPSAYAFNTDAYSFMGLGSGQHFGLVAQDVEAVSPNLVQEIVFPERRDEEGNLLSESFTYKGVNYIELIPISIAAIQELNAKITSLEAQIAATDEAKMLQQNPDYEQNVKLGNTQVPILYQNTPNPHKGDCTIKYFVPEIISSCEVHFFDMYGNAIKVVPINQTGMGQLNIDAHDLAAGSYSYALVIDGVVAASKVMIRE